MAYGILVAGRLPVDAAVAWPFRIQLADKAASVLNPSVDLGQAAFWYVTVKAQVKTATSAGTLVLQSADALAGTGNVQQLGNIYSFAITVLGSSILGGWFPRSQQYLNIVATGATIVFDAEVWATQLK